MAYLGLVNRARAAGESHPLALALLIAANALPLAGVLFLGWDVGTILILYWVENGIVGLLNVPKILLASRSAPRKRSGLDGSGRPLFFLFHYGLFWAVHGVFVFVLTTFVAPADPVALAGRPLALVTGTAFLLVSHMASFYLNFLGHREYLHISPEAQRLQPYPRLFVLHLTVLLGGLGVIALGQPFVLVALLVVFKTIVDVALFVRERSQITAAVTSAAMPSQGRTGPKGSETTTGG